MIQFLVSIRSRFRKNRSGPLTVTCRSSHVQFVHGLVFELDFLPGLHSDGELRATGRRLGEDVRCFLLKLATLIARLHASLERNAVGRGARRITPGVSLSTATKLQTGIVAENGDQGGHMPDMDAAGGRR